MKAAIHYPDLAVPPTGWTYVRVGTQMRLSPPKKADEKGVALIIVSPIIARHPRLPPIEQLIEMSIDAEDKIGFQLTERIGPTPITTTTGLAGFHYEVRGFARPSSPPERRVYVMYSDDKFYYGINYVADEPTYEKYVELFFEVARSVKPFEGRIATPPAPSDDGPANPYQD